MDIQDLPNPYLTPVDLQVAESPEWAPFFEGFTEPLTTDVKAQMAKNFIDFISKELSKIFRKAIERAKRLKY